MSFHIVCLVPEMPMAGSGRTPGEAACTGRSVPEV